jgi:hypothetical protein
MRWLLKKGGNLRQDERHDQRRVIDRRSVLVATTAIAQASLLPPLEAQARSEPEEAKTGQLRYAETDHIRAFYARSRF